MGDEFEDDLLFLLHSSLLLISIYLLIYAARSFSSNDGDDTDDETDKTYTDTGSLSLPSVFICCHL